MREIVFAYRPNFARMYDSCGTQTITEYCRSIYAGRAHTSQYVSDAIARVTEKILGARIGERVEESLRKSNYISTVDHHGPLSYPGFFQPDLLRTVCDREASIPATIVLSCASVSLDNHTFPRGFSFFDEGGARVRIPFFTLRDRHRSVYGQRPLSPVDVKRALAHCRARDQVKGLSALLEDSMVYQHPTYRSQITYINHALMQKVSPEGSDFVSISIEDVVSELLSTDFIHENVFISNILFMKEYRDLFLYETNGIQTSHDFSRKDTTVLFWGLEHGVRVPLRMNGEFVCNETGSLQVHLDPTSIQVALKEEVIFPNLALCLIALSSEGMHLGGGFFQVDYMPSLIEHANFVAKSIGLHELSWGSTDYFGGDYTFLPTFLENEVTALDILGNPPCAIDIIHYANHVTVAQAIDRIIPEMYHILENRLQSEWNEVVMHSTDSQ